MGKRSFWPLVAVVIVMAVNAAANIVPLGGYNTGTLSAMYPTGFTPAGRTFSIWSLIYLGLLAFGITAWVGAPRIRERISAIAGPFYLNALGNVAWIFVWHWQFVEASFVVMVGMLATLVVIFRRLRELPAPTRGEFFAVDGLFLCQCHCESAHECVAKEEIARRIFKSRLHGVLAVGGHHGVGEERGRDLDECSAQASC